MRQFETTRWAAKYTGVGADAVRATRTPACLDEDGIALVFECAEGVRGYVGASRSAMATARQFAAEIVRRSRATWSGCVAG